jgi:hypothetical protein
VKKSGARLLTAEMNANLTEMAAEFKENNGILLAS